MVVMFLVIALEIYIASRDIKCLYMVWSKGFASKLEDGEWKKTGPLWRVVEALVSIWEFIILCFILWQMFEILDGKVWKTLILIVSLFLYKIKSD